jgi:hypothetical protein
MTGFTHLIVGAAAATYAPSFVLSPIYGLVSHFVFDAVPHDDYVYFHKNHWKIIYLSPTAIVPAFVGGLIVLVFGLQRPDGLSILMGAFFGILPDLLTGFWKIFGLKPSRFDRFHGWIHGNRDLGELFYKKVQKGTLLPKDSKCIGQRENWLRIKATSWGKFGWGIELFFELITIISAIWALTI